MDSFAIDHFKVYFRKVPLSTMHLTSLTHMIGNVPIAGRVLGNWNEDQSESQRLGCSITDTEIVYPLRVLLIELVALKDNDMIVRYICVREDADLAGVYLPNILMTVKEVHKIETLSCSTRNRKNNRLPDSRSPDSQPCPMPPLNISRCYACYCDWSER